MNKEEKLASKCCNKPVIISNGKYFCSGVYGCGNWCEVYIEKQKTIKEEIEILSVEYFDLPFPSSENSIVLSIKDAKNFTELFVKNLLLRIKKNKIHYKKNDNEDLESIAYDSGYNNAIDDIISSIL